MGSQVFRKRHAIYMHHVCERAVYLFSIGQITPECLTQSYMDIFKYIYIYIGALYNEEG